MNRRQFLGLSSAALLATAGLYATELERHALVIEEQTHRLPGLADAFHNMRIAQISDIHYDEFTEPYFVREVVAKVNALRPDMVVLTGDYVSRGPLPGSFAVKAAYRCAEVLQTLDCPLRYAILGNHDVMVNMARVTDAIVSHGIPVLGNQYLPIERGSSRLWLGGVRDVDTRLARVEEAVPPPNIKGQDPVILLAHEPDYADHVARHGGVDLMLSGHSHGGQVCLPLYGPVHSMLPPLGRKYVQGLFRVGNTRLYVNRGIGTVGLPLRVLCPPEITIHTLTPA